VDPDVLQEVNRLCVIGRVVSNTTHDVNNALQVISGSAELLALRREIGPAEQRRIGAITTQTGRAATILDRLVAYARADTAERQVQDLGGLVDLALALRDFSLHRARIAVTFDRVNVTPPCRAALSRPRILQVLLNVTLNAEAALKNRSDGTIQIALTRSGDEWIVLFADNGPGMSAEQRARVSDPEPPPLTPGLSGIGLWVSRRIVEQHGGRLDLAPGQSSGTVVTLALPCA